MRMERERAGFESEEREGSRKNTYGREGEREREIEHPPAENVALVSQKRSRSSGIVIWQLGRKSEIGEIG